MKEKDLQIEDQLLTSDEVAAMLKLSRGGVKNLAKQGYLKPIRFNPKLIRYSARQVMKLVREGVDNGN